MRFKRARAVVAVVGATALGAFFLTATNADAATGHARVVVPDVQPVWATSARAVGTVSGNDSVAIRVGLQLRDAAAAEATAKGVSDPSSSTYGRYLSPKAFTARYAPTAARVKRVSDYLTSQGIKVTGIAGGNLWVEATGSVSQLNKAFGTTLRTYSYKGRTLRAPATAVTVPDVIRADVSTVSGLSQKPAYRAPLHRSVAPEKTVAKTASPSVARPPLSQCSTYWGQYQQKVPKVDGKTKVNTYICGYAPAQLRAIYGTAKTVSKGNDGHGVTVAIIDAYANPTMLSDANIYATSKGEPSFIAGQYSETTFTPFDLQAECGGEAGWNGEEALDVEAVHGMAPGASIHYIGAKNCDTGIDDAINYVIQNHTADIVSNSYGNVGEAVPADYVAMEHAMFIQAAVEGIGFYFSSGDDGDNVIDGLSPQPDYSSSDSMVTAVGGTSELISKSGKSARTTGWETSLDFIDYTGNKAQYESPLPGDFYFGAGGGTSTLFKQPYYQRGIVPNSLANRNGMLMRVAPDISADADPYTGFFYGITVDGTYTEGAIGGTSLACPLIAGIQAVAEQKRSFAIGFANPLLYSLKKSAFKDITPKAPLHFASVSGGFTGTFETGDTQSSRYGYDDITGRGTPKGTTFLKAERH